MTNKEIEQAVKEIDLICAWSEKRTMWRFYLNRSFRPMSVSLALSSRHNRSVWESRNGTKLHLWWTLKTSNQIYTELTPHYLSCLVILDNDQFLSDVHRDVTKI